jgi:glycosyltransferase involved in cell wall biosynthesis
MNVLWKSAASVMLKVYRRLPGVVRRTLWSFINRRAPQLQRKVLLGASENRPAQVSLARTPPFQEESPLSVSLALAAVGRAITKLETAPASGSQGSAEVKIRSEAASEPAVESVAVTVPAARQWEELWDIRALQSVGFGERGIGRYVREQAAAHDRIVGRSNPASHVYDDSLPLPRSLRSLGPQLRLVPQSLAFKPPATVDLWYLTSPFDDVVALPVAIQSKWFVTTCFDLIPLLMPEAYLPNPQIRRAYFNQLELIRRSDLVLCISEATAADVQRHLDVHPDRVRVIGAGKSSYFSPDRDVLADNERLRQFPLTEREYILLPGGIDPRKNLLRSITAFAKLGPALCRDHPLVIACRTTESERASLLQHARNEGVRDDVVITGYVTDAVLRSLYQSARLVLFPSTYEGFGLPVVEALACGTDVIVGDNSSLREIVPDGGRRFDADSASSITEALRVALTGPALSPAQCVELAAPHTWEQVAVKTRAALDELTARGTRRRTKTRVALVSPLPPSRSGVADYVQGYLPFLAERVAVTTFAMNASNESESVAERLAADERVFGSFDSIIVHMGNSEHHLEGLELLQRLPGRCDVVLHDVRLRGLYSELAKTRGLSLRDEIARVEGVRFLQWIEGQVGDGSGVWGEDVWMTREVLELARVVLVHSKEAVRECRLEHPLAEVRAVPFALRSPQFSSRQVERDPHLIVSVGVVADSKDPSRLIEAVSLLRKRGLPVRLVFAGPGTLSATAASNLSALAELRQAGALSEVGFCEEDVYWDLLRTAAAVVQLRVLSNGETSAAVGDAIAAGAPLVADRLAMRGFDSRAARLVDTTDPTALADAIAAVLTGGRDDSMALAQKQQQTHSHADACAAAVLRAVGCSV